MSEQTPAEAAPAEPVPASPADRHCLNCGAPSYGPYCHACGQPEKGMIRPLANVMSDIADTIFNVDSRIFRSIPALYFRPGHLTREYFLGRRTRYVTPFRLFFFLCVIAFFAVQASMDLSGIRIDGEAPVTTVDRGGIEDGLAVADVEQRLQAALEGLDKARAAPGLSQEAAQRLDEAERAVRRRAAQRLEWLAQRDLAVTEHRQPPPDPRVDQAFSLDGSLWDPVREPIEIAWLPGFANHKLTELGARVKGNIEIARRDPRHLIAGLFSVAPQTLFVLMPLFAVLLKIVYVFKRRLYMEHLIVALHSHAFIFLSLLLVALLSLGIGWLAPHAAWLEAPLRLLRAAVWIWLPVYLFLMQKRVYRHGWPMAVISYGVVGTCYLMILTFGLLGALFVSLALL